ncbi:myeloperoxidase [Octopus bimaculoides]|uniref:Uncharacterized protein n=1 Tax=Octopus bimaculoides TaxID=37653 RepID=A0A0L8GBQ5_OCTBM|nr:myeloperoxidase [Octopus bimaculoides]
MDEHNRLVNKMTQFGVPNPSGEARKLLIGIFQHITYNEYLPMLLGANTPVRSLPTGTRTPNSTLPMVFHSFTLAYTLAMASMMRETVTIVPTSNVNLKSIINDATQIDTDVKLASITKGMLIDCSLKLGKQIPCDFRNDCAYSDIVAIASQDTQFWGIPTYYIWLYISNSLPAENLPLQDTAHKTKLLDLYGNPYDIGFLPGGFLETITGPSMLGPTLTKLFEEQFKKLQEGDRLYYEHDGVFESYQLRQIRNMTMARLLCRNVNGLTEVKEKAFNCSSIEVDCSSLPDIDFCEYHCISREWSDFGSISPVCTKIDIQVRYCKSTNPTQCPCIDIPFRLTPCPNALADKRMVALLNMYAIKASKISEFIAYYIGGYNATLHDKITDGFIQWIGNP